MDVKIIEDIRRIVQGEQPESDISQLLYEHKCLYLLSRLNQNYEYVKKCMNDLAINKITVSERYTACEALFTALEAVNISYAVIKGSVLSQCAYGDTAYRKSGDIDLLVDRTIVDDVKKLMLEHNFVQGRVNGSDIKPFNRQELLFQTAFSHQTAPFIKRTESRICPFINVDINTDIMWGEAKSKTDMACVMKQTTETEICGIKVKKLTPVMEFISLCLHHYKDMNSIYLLWQGSLNLALLCDIYFYLKNNRLDADELKEICKRLNSSEYVYYCLYYTREIFGDDFLQHYLSAVKTERAADILGAFGLDESEIKQWDTPFSERLFCNDFQSMLDRLLTDKDREKVSNNMKFM